MNNETRPAIGTIRVQKEYDGWYWVREWDGHAWRLDSGAPFSWWAKIIAFRLRRYRRRVTLRSTRVVLELEP